MTGGPCLGPKVVCDLSVTLEGWAVVWVLPAAALGTFVGLWIVGKMTVAREDG